MLREGFTIRPFVPEDADFVIAGHLALYKAEYGLDTPTWEAYLKGGVRAFISRFDGERDCMLILEHGGVPCGCAAVAHMETGCAQFRFFFVDPCARGAGAGSELLSRAIGFCREKKYARIFLWTFSTLLAARHLYLCAGFRLMETRENSEWGTPILEERWELELPG